MASTKLEGSARDRLLAAANELFYGEGLHAVGIDRVIERAGVAKASLYNTFGSKEELVRAYLEARAKTRQERISNRVARYEHPRDRILAVFDLLAEIASEPTFRGCAFINASAEDAGGETPVRQACVDSRAWVRALFVELARDLGVRDPARLGRQLALLYDGAIVGASIERDRGLPAEARAMAEALLDAQAPAERSRARPAASGSSAGSPRRRGS